MSEQAERGVVVGNWTSAVANLGSTGVLCWLVLWQMPDMNKAFSDNLRSMQDRQDKQIERITASLDKLTDKISHLRPQP